MQSELDKALLEINYQNLLDFKSYKLIRVTGFAMFLVGHFLVNT